jgi:hypothetical protein
MDDWYYAVDGIQQGPVTRAMLLQLLNAGGVPGATVRGGRDISLQINDTARCREIRGQHNSSGSSLWTNGITH